MKRLQASAFRTPLGWCAAAWSPLGLSVLTLPQPSQKKTLREVAAAVPGGVPIKTAGAVPAPVVLQTLRVLDGRSHRLPPLDLFFLTPFQKRVLQATALIPAGETRPYAWVARRAGCPKGGRAAGNALNRNPVPLLVPCHRVVATGGGLGGFGGGTSLKIRLLKRENAWPLQEQAVKKRRP